MALRFFDRQVITADLVALPSERLREVALGWMRRLERDRDLGEPCGWSSGTGDLSDCRKLYFDYDDDPRVISLDTRRRQRHYRIIYRPIEDDMEIVAVGPGHPPPGHDAVYVTAGVRLGRVKGTARRLIEDRHRRRGG